MVQDQTGRLTPAELAVETEKLVAAARKRPELANLNSSFRASVPQYSIEAARDVALKQGVPVQDLFLTLQAYLGGVYVNDFNRFGRQVAGVSSRRSPRTGRRRTRSSSSTCARCPGRWCRCRG